MKFEEIEARAAKFDSFLIEYADLQSTTYNLGREQKAERGSVTDTLNAIAAIADGIFREPSDHIFSRMDHLTNEPTPIYRRDIALHGLGKIEFYYSRTLSPLEEGFSLECYLIPVREDAYNYVFGRGETPGMAVLFSLQGGELPKQGHDRETYDATVAGVYETLIEITERVETQRIELAERMQALRKR